MWSFTSAVAAMLDTAKMTTVTSLDDVGSSRSQPFQMSCSRFHQVLKIKSSASYVASNSTHHILIVTHRSWLHVRSLGCFCFQCCQNPQCQSAPTDMDTGSCTMNANEGILFSYQNL
ncbi:hypothetical protein M758_2G226100 [Ceratodon purpureus]|nr:hypothetical protein M758_2G226100 [Ceratodon purpureus]